MPKAGLCTDLEFTQQVDEKAFAGIALIGQVVRKIRYAITDTDFGIFAQMAINCCQSAEPLIACQIVTQIAAFDHSIPLFDRAPVETQDAQMGSARDKLV